MHPNDLALRLIQRLGKLLGLEELTLQGGTHNCALEFDGAIIVTFEYHESSARILLTSRLAAMPAEAGETLLRALLAANLGEYLQDGMTIGLAEATQEIVLLQGRPVMELDDASFETMVEKFVDRAELWQKRIQEGALGQAYTMPDHTRPTTSPVPIVDTSGHIFG